MRAAVLALAVLLGAVPAGCGKRGDPVPPSRSASAGDRQVLTPEREETVSPDRGETGPGAPVAPPPDPLPTDDAERPIE